MFAIYDTDTGRIDRYIDAPKNRAETQLQPGEALAPRDRDTDGRYYVKPATGRMNVRPQTVCTLSRTEVPADGSTHVALSQMRPGTQIEIAGPVSMSFVAEQSSEQITFTVPGGYTLTATGPWPAQPTTVTIRAA